MKTTDLTTRDSDIEVIFGNIKYRDNIRQEAYGALKYLYTDLTDIRKYYIRLGFHLDEFRRYGYCIDFGYACLEDFCEKNLGLDKSAVSRCINVFRAFNAGNDVTFKNDLQLVGCKMDLSEKWKDYSYTQLCEMLPLSPEQRKDIKPDMTIKQIREYKKSLKNKSASSMQQNDSGEDPVATSQPKRFNYYEWREKRGIVQQNYIKSCDPLEKEGFPGIYIFDCNGKRILCGSCGYVLERNYNADESKIVIRMSGCFYDPVDLVDQDDPEEFSDKQPDQEESRGEIDEQNSL